MKKQQLSLVHELKAPEIQTEKPPLLLLLHGYGSHEGDLFGFADSLDKKYVIVSARAPHRLMWGGYCWYNISFTDSPNRWADPNEAMGSVEKVKTFISEIHEAYGTDPENVTIMGFSQGAILSYALSLHYPKMVKYIMGLSGYIYNDIMPKQIKPAEVAHLEYYVIHGTQDQVIPVEWARNSVQALEQMQLRHSYREYPMPHGITPEAFNDILKWMRVKQLI